MLRHIAQAAALALALAPSALIATKAAARPVVEVAFVLDTTGSMGPLIEGAKRKKTPARSGDSFDRAVEKTLRAQIAR